MKSFVQYVGEAKVDKVMKDFTFKSEKEAEDAAKIFGLKGTHKQGKMFMPGKDHKTFLAFAKKHLTEGKKDYKIYHTMYSDAVGEAVALAQKQGFEVDEDDFFNQVTTGPRKPSEGKTNSFKILLKKNGKEVRKRLVFQVYGMKRQYELTAYVS